MKKARNESIEVRSKRSTRNRSKGTFEDRVESSVEQTGKVPLVGESFKPKTAAQAEYQQAIEDGSSVYVFGIGAAGAGKTHVAVSLALEMMAEGRIQELVVTRPAKEAGEEELGLLPGELDEKFSPYLTPIKEIAQRRLPRGMWDYLVKVGRIRAIPLGFMRGMTFNNAFILADEAQNISPALMKMLVTRIGYNSKMVIDGDVSQSDISGPNGLQDAIKRIGKLRFTRVVEFQRSDCVRHGAIAEVLAAYEKK